MTQHTRLVCIGNPLLDMSVRVDSTHLLDKYQLKYDDVREADSTHLALFDEILNRCDVSYSPGGGAQNTARIFRWCMSAVAAESACDCVAFMGALGRDTCGQLLEKLVQRDGVMTRYIYHETTGTGRSANIVHGADRSLVADIGAAASCPARLLLSASNVELISRAHFVYIEGFLLTHDADTAFSVADLCSRNGVATPRLVLSLSGVYVCREHYTSVARLMSTADYLFCHVTEFTALAQALGLPSDVEPSCEARIQLLTRAAQLAHQQGDSDVNTAHDAVNHSLCVVVTQSASPVLVIDQHRTISVPVPVLEAPLIADTTAAGDAFVAGFLAASLHNLPPPLAATYGMSISRELIQQTGCTLPDHEAPLLPDRC